MNPINHFELNRPIHLARRDIYFEKAVELISSQQLHGGDLRIEDFEEILFMLRTAREHARFSIRNADNSENDEQFSRFINLMAGNIKSVLAMLNLKQMVENGQEATFGFLGGNEASVGLQAEEYLRRANDIVRSIQSTLKLAQEPFENLKAENREMATDEENERYNKAREHFTKLVKERLSIRRIPSIIRKFMRF